jgi:hypothetical protein
MSTLQRLWEERSGQPEFKLRDEAYRVFESAYLSRSTDGKEQFITWRPQVYDAPRSSAAQGQMLNLSRQIVSHHQAAFTRLPRYWNVPVNKDAFNAAQENTAFVRRVFSASRAKALQSLQSWRLSCRGEAIYGLEWSTEKREIKLKAYDPACCYPSFDPDDPGGLQDLLVQQTVGRLWAERAFGIALPSDKQAVNLFTYWDCETRRVAIEEHDLQEPYFMKHDLGFVPFRWCYGSPNNHFAQSDIVETPKIQGLVNQTILLVLNAARRRVDKAYWGVGLRGDVVPQPGKVISFPNPQASIQEFPTADPPSELMGIISLLQNFAQSMAGVSPISSEGMATGSIVTGSAVRHQVEAIEARAETKRTSVEQTVAITAEFVLRVLGQKFPDAPQVQAMRSYALPVNEVNADPWWRCEAAYGGFEGLPVDQRMQQVLAGLGRVVGIHKAVELVFPDEDPEVLIKDIRDYQLQQAALTGQSQAVSQAAAQQESSRPTQISPPTGSGGAPPGPGSSPQLQQQPQPPGGLMLAAGRATGRQQVKLGDVQSAVQAVAPSLHGDVWAVGELALTGMAQGPPELAVEDERDRARIQGLVPNSTVSVGVEPDEPKVTLT